MSEATENDANQSASGRSTVLNRAYRVYGYWFKLIFQPILAVLFVLGLVWLFGFAQRNFNWFTDAATSAGDAQAEEGSVYACSMLCVFLEAPGRCPVCGMELQEIEITGDPKDLYGVTVAPTARRLANIKTIAALNMPVPKDIEAFGQISYDETSESTISAYVGGRIVDLQVDFTGARVEKGDALAILYSPDLYADQVGLLSAKKAYEEGQSNNPRVNESNKRLYESARRRLIEFGLPESQVAAIEQRGKANNHIRIFAPMSGTVVEKLVEEGKYIKTGMPILKLADLSKVWLLLEMYPKDTVKLRIGQKAEVAIQSQAGKTFEGKVSFISPMVDKETNTVKVRIEIPNEAGLIKIGDYANAQILSEVNSNQDLVIVPRSAVMVNGQDSIAFVETRPGRFEYRKVKIAETIGDKIALSDGIKPGEAVVHEGVFMLESTFNIQGKVSLIDPNRADRQNQAKISAEAEAKEIAESFSKLTNEDRKLAEEQVICPVMEVKLGSMGMGAPKRVKLPKGDVMICCEGCRKKLVADPDKYYAILENFKSGAPTPEELAEIKKSFAPLSKEDRALAEKQVICPVTEVRLGTKGMGTPIRVDLDGTPIMICCEGCRRGLLKDPAKHLEILKQYHSGKKQSQNKKSGQKSSGELPKMDLPKMDLPKMDLPKMDLPKMEVPN